MKRIILLLVLASFLGNVAFSQSRSGKSAKTTAVRKSSKKKSVSAKPRTLEQELVGRHMLSLQWISWDYFGSCNITKIGDNEYKCVGEQLSKEYPGDYLKIDGVITPVDRLHLIFTGTIKTKVYHLNNGEEYVREGTFDFKSTQGRKYWREQEMKGADGVCDYVDIYMKR